MTIIKTAHRRLIAGGVLMGLAAGCAGKRSRDYEKQKGTAQETPAMLPASNANTRVILQVDGGGILGITPAIVLAELEKQVNQKTGQNRPLGDRLSLASGASTGAIITSLLAARVRASEIKKFYLGKGVDLFNQEKKALNPFALFDDKYRRDPFLKTLSEVLGTNERCGCTDISLGKLPDQPVLVVPAFELRSGRTFIFQSREPGGKVLKRHENIMLSDLISWSALSAAYYFGSVPAPEHEWEHYDVQLTRYPMKGAVFQDGGQGTQNNTLGLVMLQRRTRNWERDPTIIISLGTGGDTNVYPYEEAAGLKHWQQVFAYSTVGSNQARHDAWQMQVLGTMMEEANRKNLSFYRFNHYSEAEMDDASPKSVADCKAAAEKMIAEKKFSQLVDQLAALATYRPPTKAGDQFILKRAATLTN